MRALGYFKLVIILAACLPGLLAQSTTTSPIPPYNVTACCIEENVIQKCMELCTYDVNVEIIKNMTNPLSCIPEGRKLLTCAAGGRNHTDCCFASGVKSPCLSFCAGSLPAVFDDSLMECLNHLGPMSDCMKIGQDVIPSAPINVTAVLVSSEDGRQSMRVSWLLPSIHPDRVTYYLVQVEQRQESDSLKNRTIRRVPSNTLNVTVAIQEAELYLVNVVAANDFGRSYPSRTMQVKPDIPQTTEDDNGDLLPTDTPVTDDIAVIVAVVVVVGILITIGVVVAGILVCRRERNPRYARQEEMRAQIQPLQSAPTGLSGQPGSPTTNATTPAYATAAAASNSSIMPELKPDEVTDEGLLATPGERKQE